MIVLGPSRGHALLFHGLLLFLAALLSSGRAEVALPAIFGDHMVLQQGARLPVWGTAAPGEKVTVTVGGESATATASAEGKWRVDLAPLPLGAAPLTMTVRGANTLTFTDVLVGEVWLCSGQSNMGFPLGALENGHWTEHAAERAQPDWRHDAQLRLFTVDLALGLDPATDLKGKWELCTPPSTGPFSAVGYLFGRELRARLQRPVGLIGSYLGGTPAESWTSLEGLKMDAILAHHVARLEKAKADFAAIAATYPAKKAEFEAAQAKVDAQNGPTLKTWNEAVSRAVAAGQPPPPKPALVLGPAPPVQPLGAGQTPTTLYNGMIAPLMPFAIKGVIWYQGENNMYAPEEYRVLFPDLVQDWRAHWGEGDFPFLFVLVAGMEIPQNWALLREAQLGALRLPQTGVVSAADIGDPKDMHPKDKWDVGQRLAQAALRVAYGDTKEDAPPTYRAMTIEGGKASLHFDIVSGLVIGHAPWFAPGVIPPPTDHLTGFAVAGADRKWVRAEARIVAPDEVEISSPGVTRPEAVRYNWSNFPQGNLYDQAGLPATPFRTDSWPEPNVAPPPLP